MQEIYQKTICNPASFEGIGLHSGKKSKITIMIGKQTFYKKLEMPLKKAYAYTSKLMTKNMIAMDAKEGISAFVEKRKPKWKHKYRTKK